MRPSRIRPVALLVPLLLALILGSGIAPSWVEGLDAAPAPRANAEGTAAPFGGLLAWGYDTEGQLGDGTAGAAAPAPQGVTLPTSTPVIAVAAGVGHSLALLADGTIWAWGWDATGQLGDGAAGGIATTPQPVPLPGGARAVAIAAGAFHSLALLADGTMLAWGSDALGELGDGAAETTGCQCHPAPQPVLAAPATPLTGVAAISAGTWHSLALLADGTVLAWGRDHRGQLGDGAADGELDCAGDCDPTPHPVSLPGGARVTAIAAGSTHSLALLADGSVLAWGDDVNGALGDGAAETTGCLCHPTPQPVLAAPATPLTGVTAIASSSAHSLALLADGTARAWGRDAEGQLGDGAAETTGCVCHPTPRPVVGLTGVAALSAGGSHSAALLADGTVSTWGNDVAGQLGDGTLAGEPDCTGGCNPTPQPVPGLAGIAAIATGGGHTLVLVQASTTGAWGADYAGQLGDGTAANPSAVPVPQGVPGATDIVTIAAGSNHNLALKRDGTVLAWGSDSNGQLGDGTVGGPAICSFGNCAPTPQPVIGVGGVGLLGNIIAVSGGEDHSLALRADGRVIAWGSDSSGQLGDGTRGSPERTATPQLVPGVTDAIAIAAGPHHSLALKADGTIVSWGNDLFGELGDGAANGEPACGGGSCNPTPQAVLMPTGARATAISAGGRQSLALLADGTVLAWGPDSVGETGDGTPATSGCFCEATPRVVPGVSGIVAIAAGGGGHNLALKADGTVVAWGRDGTGQLGDGSPQFSGCGCHPNAQPVPGLTNIVAIAAGFFHNFALKSDGTLMTWGANNNGQLGDGTTVNSGCFCRPAPQRVPGVNRVAAVTAGADTSLVILAAPAATATAADDKGAVYGAASVSLSATVTSGAGAVNGGPVTFTVKNAGSATVGVAVTGQVNASGVASATFAIPAGTPAGGYTVEASYGGALSFNASNDPSPATLTIGKAATSATIGTPGTLPSCGSGSMTIPVTIANTSNDAALTGGAVTVTLTQGATVVGSGSAVVSGVDPVTVNVVVALSGLGAGTVAVNASYGGDGNFQGSAAAPTSFVSPLTATTVTVQNATATYGDASVTLTATVASANGAALTGGTVTFVVKKGTQVVATLTSGPVAGASPRAVSVTLPLDASYDARSYSVTATYSGNACFATGSGTGTLTVARKVLWLKASDQAVGLNQPNPSTVPPANCLANATATAACGVQLSNSSGFVYGQSWGALGLTNLRFQYARNPPSTNATEFVGKTYRITAFGVTSSNYDIRYEAGTLTVVP